MFPHASACQGKVDTLVLYENNTEEPSRSSRTISVVAKGSIESVVLSDSVVSTSFVVLSDSVDCMDSVVLSDSVVSTYPVLLAKSMFQCF